MANAGKRPGHGIAITHVVACAFSRVPGDRSEAGTPGDFLRRGANDNALGTIGSCDPLGQAQEGRVPQGNRRRRPPDEGQVAQWPDGTAEDWGDS